MSIIFYECIHSMLLFWNGEPNHEHSPRRLVPTHLRLFAGILGCPEGMPHTLDVIIQVRGVYKFIISTSVFLPFRNFHEDGTAQELTLRKLIYNPHDYLGTQKMNRLLGETETFTKHHT